MFTSNSNKAKDSLTGAKIWKKFKMLRTVFNNVYTPCLKSLLTGPGHTPPSGKEWEDMVAPFKWAVYKFEHRRKYIREKAKYMEDIDDESDPSPYPEYVELPPEATTSHPLPKRTDNRSNFVTYFMVGPMAPGLYGLDVQFGFDLAGQAPSTKDRTKTNRKAQRKKKKDLRAQMLLEAKARTQMERDVKARHQSKRKAKKRAIKKRRSTIKDQYRLAMTAKHSSDNDVRMELDQRRTQIHNVSSVLRTIKDLPGMEDEVNNLTQQLLKIVKAPHPDPRDPSTFMYVKTLVPVPSAAYKLVDLSGDASANSDEVDVSADVDEVDVNADVDEVDVNADADIHLDFDMDADMDEVDRQEDDEDRVDLTRSPSAPSSPTPMSRATSTCTRT